MYDAKRVQKWEMSVSRRADFVVVMWLWRERSSVSVRSWTKEETRDSLTLGSCEYGWRRYGIIVGRCVVAESWRAFVKVSYV